jgi:nucleoside 2-deoxyribosyltransferase
MRIYLAGPEVFMADRGAAVGAEKRAICAAHGLTGVLPVEEGEGRSAPPIRAGSAFIAATRT